jgi:hypothetical protein
MWFQYGLVVRVIFQRLLLWRGWGALDVHTAEELRTETEAILGITDEGIYLQQFVVPYYAFSAL